MIYKVTAWLDFHSLLASFGQSPSRFLQTTLAQIRKRFALAAVNPSIPSAVAVSLVDLFGTRGSLADVSGQEFRTLDLALVRRLFALILWIAPVPVVDLEQTPVGGPVAIVVLLGGVHATFVLHQAYPVPEIGFAKPLRQQSFGQRTLVELFGFNLMSQQKG